MLTMFREHQEVLPLIGKIEYLDNNGNVFDYTDYDNEEELIQDVRDELHWDVPIIITLYRNEHGETISPDFIYTMDCLPKGFHVADKPAVRA